MSTRQKSRQRTRVVMTLSSSDARDALGFFRQKFEIDGTNLTLGEALKKMKTTEGKSVSDVLVENEAIKPMFGMFIDGRNVEAMQGLKTPIDDKKQVVVIELLSRIAGG